MRLMLIGILSSNVLATDVTQSVQSYFQTRWNLSVSNFESQKTGIERSAAAQGGLCSGATIKEENLALVSIVDQFIGTSIGYAQSATSPGNTIDKIALTATLNGIKSQAISKIVTSICTITVPPDAKTKTDIESRFELAGLQIQTLPSAGILKQIRNKSTAIQGENYCNALGRQYSKPGLQEFNFRKFYFE